MLCRTREPRAAHARETSHLTSGNLRRVFGTWDFKWPQGSAIRVAFQRLPHDHPELEALKSSDHEVLMDSLIKKTVGLANQWVSKGGQPTAAIRFQWLDNPDERLPPPAHYQSAASAELTNVPYDVLVSFAPLPVIEPDSPERPGETHPLPSAHLGTYARREDAGVPTVYLGRPFYMGKVSLPEYFASEQFRHCVIHEFGHVLGLAHEHQNPTIYPRPAWRDAESMARIFSAHIDRPRTPEMAQFAQRNIIEAWPHTADNGRVLFSDWRTIPSRADGLYVIDSIMVDPLYRSYLADSGVTNGAEAAKQEFARHAPSDSDLAALRTMYPLDERSRSRDR